MVLGRYVTAFFTEYGLPKAGLIPSLTVRNVANNAIVVGPVAMASIGAGFYKYWWATYDETLAYVLIADGGVALPVGERYKESANVIDDQISDKAKEATLLTVQHNLDIDIDAIRVDTRQILDLLQNQLVISEATSELWLYDDAGVNVIKKWPLRDHLGGAIHIVGHAPTDRMKKTFG